MITDKLLAFADGKAITATATSDEIDLGKGGDEIARTLNLVAQIDDPSGVTPTAAKVTPKLQGHKNGSWVDIMQFPEVSVADCIAGKRLIEFAKLPLGMAAYSKLRLNMTVESGPLVGAKYSAWLTPSAELDK